MTNPLKDKNILLGVTGSIAAYKAVDLSSKLHQAGAIVNVILTNSAEKFVTPLSFQSVTGRKTNTESDLWGSEGHVTHIALGQSADFMVIAPATANTIAKLANGIADNLLTVTALAATCDLMIAPAMDAGMYNHSATQENIKVLQERGSLFIGPESGHLASGLVGPGRMTEPMQILNHMRLGLSKGGPLVGKKIVITAGPTQEPIDPVRMLTNRSTGRQGFTIAQAAMDAGAQVVIISGPSCLNTPTGARLIKVKTTSQMLETVLQETLEAEALIMAAAPADFRPQQTSEQKVKKSSGYNTIPLEPTEDILKHVAQRKEATGFPRKVIGFAAETEQLMEHAQNKLQEKQLDLIAANNISVPGVGFASKTNQVTLISSNGKIEELPLMDKEEVAEILITRVCKWATAEDRHSKLIQ
jgi:phosphopantothenoylcysteine decarboxylase / phosphopantothenate---cysteine ligase